MCLADGKIEGSLTSSVFCEPRLPCAHVSGVENKKSPLHRILSRMNGLYSLVCIFLLIGVAQAFFASRPRAATSRGLQMAVESAPKDPKYQQLLDKIKNDPSFNACADPQDRQVLMMNGPDRLRAVDNVIKRVAGAFLDPIQGPINIEDFDKVIKSSQKTADKALTAPKSKFFKSPAAKTIDDFEATRAAFIEECKQDGKQLPASFK